MSEVRWSIVTVAYNSAQDLAGCWSKPPAGVEWIVVDNDSSDDSTEIARSLGATVVKLDSNLGFSAANNAGLEHARGMFVCFANPDVTLEYATLEELERAMGSREVLVGPQLLNDDGSLQPNGRGMPTPYAKLRNRFRGGRFAIPSYNVTAKPGELVACVWLMGAAVAGRVDVVRSLGGWDDGFFVYYEDSDLGLRAWKRGIAVLLVGDVRWKHGWNRETARRFRLKPWVHEFRSATRFYVKYPWLVLGERVSQKRYPFPVGSFGARPVAGSEASS